MRLPQWLLTGFLVCISAGPLAAEDAGHVQAKRFDDVQSHQKNKQHR